MPRLTNPDYVKIHHYLRDHWVQDPMPYSLLSPDEQWDLHAYFQPYVGWDDRGIIDYREQISKKQPSLPQRAGRALRQFEEATKRLAQMRAWKKEHPVLKYKADRPVTVYPLVKPEIDAHQIARTFIAYVKWRARQADETDLIDE